MLQNSLSAKIVFDRSTPQVAFAAQELQHALQETGQKGIKITIAVDLDGASPEAFKIRTLGNREIVITGADAKGAMYGGLEVADRLRLGLPIEDGDHKPFVEKRGIKFNIPLDARTPSYDDTGDAAQKNIETMWDFEFWKDYLDGLARNRYNVLSLWTTHAFPNIIKLDEYPDLAMEDVYRIKEGTLNPDLPRDLFKSFDADKNGAIEPKDGTIELVKKISIEEKVAHWQKVFKYAEDRGLEIYLFSWNVFTHGATGRYGITQQQDNPATIDYTRKSVSEMLRTYPQITGLGVCAGENADWYTEGDRGIESFIYKTFGRGIMDVQEEQPDREMRFIFRRHVTDHPSVTEAFQEYTGGPVDTSIKYAVAHMYSSRRPQEWETRIVREGWLDNYKVWLNMRNDDLFLHRWGNPSYVRDFIKWMPHEHMVGFYMGSDGYVWAREFTAKNPEMSGRLEIDKHWYRFRLWGQLAYNNKLDRAYWEATLHHRFPGVDAALLYDAWESTGEIVPQLNRSTWYPTDASFAAEGCMSIQGFLTVDDYYFERKPMPLSRIENAPDPQCLSVTDWAKGYLGGKMLPGVTPLQVAENLDTWAAKGQAALPALREQAGDNTELKETLNDIESMSYLGRYYADKIRGAAKLAVYRESGRQNMKYHKEAVAHLKDAVEEWKAYAAILSTQYKPSLLARTHYLDWNATLKEVEKEVVTVQQEGDYPKIRFSNLKDGQRLSEGSELVVKVKATDGDGVPGVKLYLNGLSVKEDASAPQSWSGRSDEILESMKPGSYHLRAVAKDRNGLVSEEEIQIVVGNVSTKVAPDWGDEIHEVILSEGETIAEGSVFDFPRLGCRFVLEVDGMLALLGSDSDPDEILWKTRGKADRPHPQPFHVRFYAAIEEGRLRVYRGTPDNPDVLIWESSKQAAPGPYKLGVTASKKLAVFRVVEDGDAKIVWKTN